jgi:PAS domain S-box-containing protein
MPESLIDLAGLQLGAEEFLVAVLETTRQPFWVVDRDDVIRFANPAALAALGYDEGDDLSGHSSHATIHYRHKDGTPFPADECPLLRPLVAGDTVTSELDWFVRRDGSIFPVSYVSVPLETPKGRGAVVTFTDIEDRLRAERELHEREMALAAQQASLRQVAALVAGGAASAEVFGAIAREVAHLLGLSLVAVWRYEPDDTVTVLGAWSDRPHPLQPGTRWPLDGPALVTLVKETSRPVRVEDFGQVAGAIGAAVREIGIRSGAGAPIVVDGRLWGAMATYRSDPEPLPRQIEDRLAEFTGLIAAAFSNTASRDELARLADEQAALRRVATLVASGVPPPEVFAAVAREVGLLFGVDATHMARYELDGTATGVAGWSPSGDHKPVGTRVNAEGDSIVGIVLRTGRAARMHNYENASGPAAALGRELGLRSSVGAPIVVDQCLWGVMIVSSKDDRPLPADTESRIAAFTELVATAISNTEARIEVGRLAEEQAALRRVATAVALGAPPGDVFALVAKQVALVLEVPVVGIARYEDDGTISARASFSAHGELFSVGTRWPLDGTNVVGQVLESGRAVRINDYSPSTGDIAETVRGLGIRSSVGIPIVVAGRLWGAMVVSSTEPEPLPEGIEERLAGFTELVATAISNAEARGELSRLAEEQAALRRVATLVARESSPAEVFGTVAEELAQLLGTEGVGMLRFEPEAAVLVAQSNTPWEPVPLGTRFTLDGENVITTVLRTGEAARLDDWSNATGSAAAMAHTLGIRSSVATPIVVEGRLWGTMIAVTRQVEPLPADIEPRIGEFTKLVATAISNTEARDELSRLAEEQGALRGVATLVAEDVPAGELFGAVVEEVGRLLEADLAGMIRYVSNDTVSPMATWGAAGQHPEVQGQWPLEGDRIATTILTTRRPAREDDWADVRGPIAEFVWNEMGVRSSVGSPIIVKGQVWGALFVHSKQPHRPLARDTEARLANFSELVATAISNAQARSEVRRLADEQAALRRVATLVAERASPAAVFDAVAAETEALLDADQVALNRLEPGDEIAVLAHRGLDVTRTPVGSRVSIEGDSATATVRRTGRPARIDSYDSAAGALAELARATGLRSSVSAPIVVEGQLWGVITASWKGEQSPPADTEQRISRFAQLLDTAIANAEARAELMASRARLVAASDEARRRFERDLHDGAQQRLVSLSLELHGAEAMAPPDNEELAEQLTQVGNGLAEALDDLRELSRGIHPAILSEGGLVPALKTLARRSAVPVQLDLAIADRLPEHVEIGAYYVVSEALTNATKHARASKVEVHARELDGVLELKIDDDGVGGADPSRGSGLTGLADRVEALGGTIWIASPPGEGTLLRVELSLDSQ